MAEATGKPSHTVMSKKLAEALMESSMQHFAAGGIAGAIGAGDNYSAPDPSQSINKQAFIPRINQLQGQQNDIYQQQQSLGNTLLQQSQGQGPNPALAQLNQQTGNNVAQQAALIAGQRGAGSNVGLQARIAAQSGAGIQQAAVGQEATLQAQQQLAAQQALQAQQAQMAGNSLQGEQIQQQGLGQQNSTITQGQLGAAGINAGTAAANSQASAGIIGGLLGGVGAAVGKGGLFGKAHGGTIEPQSFSQALLKGGAVPGQAKVAGDSAKNDTQPTMLSPGEEVIDRETLQDPGPIGKAARMVAAHINAKNGDKNGAPVDDKKSQEFLKHLKGGKKKPTAFADVVDARKACGGGKI